MKQALRPDFILNIPSLEKDEKAEKKGATEEERQLYHMSQSSGWVVLNKFLNNLMEELDLGNAQAIESGASFDAIGQNTVIINSTKGIIKRVLDKVDDAIEACENGQ